MSAAAPTVVAIQLSKASRAPLETVGRVRALHERGLEGDRHAKPNSKRSVLFMEVETLESFGLNPGDVREQVTVRGLILSTLVFGTKLRIGEAIFEVAGMCKPCERMEELQSGLRAAIDGRRGRFVRVVEEGAFAVGDVIEVVPPA